MNKLSVSDIIKNGIEIGLKNFIPLILATILYVLTIWIPYLNVGTTIGMSMLPVEMAKGKTISPTSIFDAKNRKYMGEFFILMGLMMMAIYFGFAFLIIPGIVISIAFSLGIYLLIDKEVHPLKALSLSNKIMYDNKLSVFLSSFLFIISIYIIGIIFGFISQYLAGFFMFLAIFLIIPIMQGMKAYIYKSLVLDNENWNKEDSN
ncbi:MAG: hypothetical protein COA67_12255 [Lutibacter sp.]|nr:MAG: hypothetical protein COA67_12255 [Lutibacter sp.]